MKKILTIAGSDSGGGAGIQADLKTIAALGEYGASVITSITAQNTLGVQGAYPLDPSWVEAQLDSVCSDIAFDAAKTGMLANAEIIHSVSAKIRQYALSKVVVDPVMVATSGDVLLEKQALEALVTELLPLAYLVTPNMSEAAVLSGQPVRDLAEMRSAAVKIHQLGPRYVLVKGGHLPEEAVDILYDGENFLTFSAPKVATENTHGTGCTLSSALALYLGRGASAAEAVQAAKTYLTKALEAGRTMQIGHGHGPVCHHFALLEEN